MMYRRIADSILSHKETHKNIKRLDKVASRHIIACRPYPYPKHNNTTFFSHGKRIERVLLSGRLLF